MTRRSFLGCLCAALARWSLLGGHGAVVYKIEKRFSPGEYCYVRHSPGKALEIVDKKAFGITGCTVGYDGTPASLERRANLFKTFLKEALEAPTKQEFDVMLSALFRVSISLDSGCEAAAICLNIPEMPNEKGLKAALCVAAMRNSAWGDLRELLRKETCEEDARARKELAKTGVLNTPYGYSERERLLFNAYLENHPEHWVHLEVANRRREADNEEEMC